MGACFALLAALAVAAAADTADDEEESPLPPATFKNVKVLTGITTKAEMRAVMKEQAAALGVKCSHCHVPGKFDLDDKKEKRVGREMITLTRGLNARWFPGVQPEPVTCWSCHRGAAKVERDVPPAALAASTDPGD